MSAVTRTSTVVTRRLHLGDGVWRVERADTLKVLGRLEGSKRKWRAGASMLAFLGDGPGGGEPLGDWVPRALYQPLMASEGHHYLPGTYSSRTAAEAALLAYLDEHRAPAMGYPPHPAVRKAL